MKKTAMQAMDAEIKTLAERLAVRWLRYGRAPLPSDRPDGRAYLGIEKDSLAGAFAQAFADAEARRDAAWCKALWPANPEGAEPATPEQGGNWYRVQVREAEARVQSQARRIGRLEKALQSIRDEGCILPGGGCEDCPPCKAEAALSKEGKCG